MAVYLGKWDCNYCAHSGNGCPNVHCTHCGAPRPKDVKFYLPKEARKITAEAELEAARSGPDWSCSNCQSGNKHWDQFCGNCGSPFRTIDLDTIQEEKEYDLSTVPRSSKEPIKPQKTSRRKGLTPIKRGGIFGIILAAIGGFLATFNSPSQVEITGFEWTRKVVVEQFIEVQEEDWQLPEKATLIKSYEAIHHHDKKFKGYKTKTRTVREPAGTEQYVCGKRDLGNGYFEDKYCERTIYETREEEYQEKVYEKIPVYKTKYEYLIHRWKPDEVLKTSAKDHNPKWGYKKELADPNLYRIKSKSGQYIFIYTDHKQEQHQEEINYQLWKAMRWGDKLPAQKSLVYGYFKALNWEKIKTIYKE